MTTPIEKPSCSPFITALSHGETDRDVLEALMRSELEALEHQYRPARSQWTHYDMEARQPELGELVIFAALVGDEALWMRLVEHSCSRNYAHYKLQKWSGTSEEDLGSFPTNEIAARSLRMEAARALRELPACSPDVERVLDRWQEKIVAAARAEDDQRRQGQRLYEPARVRSWNPNSYPDLLPEFDRLNRELRRRVARTKGGAELLAKGIMIWNRRDHPDIVEGLERIEDEVARREGWPKPDIRVKVGDTVFAQGKHWKVTTVDARTGVVNLVWHEGTSTVGMPVDGDGLEPEP